MKKHYLKKMKSNAFLFIIASSILVSFESCNKEADKEVSQEKIENVDKMVKFLSITLGVPQDQVKFDVQAKQFFVPNTVFKADLEEIQNRYADANEYKLNHE